MATSSEKHLVRSTNHSLKFSNTAKLQWNDFFFSEYGNAVIAYVDYLWDAHIEYITTSKDDVVNHIWDRKEGYLDIPSMISTVGIPMDSKLSGRALKCASTQACGIVSAVVEKRVKDLRVYRYAIEHKTRVNAKLLKRLEKDMAKPACKNINAELNSVCLEINKSNETSFDIWMNFHSLFKKETFLEGYAPPKTVKYSIPIKHTKSSRKWDSMGTIMNSCLLTPNYVALRFEIPKPMQRTEGTSVGIDQGKTTCLTLSDGQCSTKDIHGHDLKTIIDKLSRKKTDSKNFKQTCDHRNNYINFSVKQLNFDGVHTVNYEKIFNIKLGKNVSREMKHFTNPIIRDSLRQHCEVIGVRFREVENQCNSIRCSECGWTQTSNRDKKNKKIFCCKHCQFTDDADFNASRTINIRDSLPVLTFEFLVLKYQTKGFFWNPNVHITSKLGEVLTVPHIQKKQ